MELVDPGDLRDLFGLGVAGNFAGHLEQAGEAGDFARVQAASAEAPKGIFPFHAPGSTGPLSVWPVSADRLVRPAGAVNLQIEPEVGVVCDVLRDADGTVAALAPRLLGAFNDCSIRREGARKISEKKHWGPASKGFAARAFAVSEIEPDGATASFRLASFLCRDGETHAYGVDSPLPEYSYYGTQLLEWIVERLRHQHGSPDTPLEDVGAMLGDANRVLVGIGATRYTTLGASTYLEVGDASVVVVYDAALSSPQDVHAAIAVGAEETLPAASVLRQRVEAP